MTAGYLHSLVSHDEIVGREGWIRRYGRGEERKRVGGGYMYSRKNRLPRVRRWRKEEGLERREGRGEEEASEGRRRSKMSEQDSCKWTAYGAAFRHGGTEGGAVLGKEGAESSGEQPRPVDGRFWYGDFSAWDLWDSGTWDLGEGEL